MIALRGHGSGVGFDCSCWITSLKKNYGQPSQPAARRPKFSLRRPEGHIAQYLISEGPVVKDFFVRRRRVLRRLRAKSSLIVLTSEILDAQHEATKKRAI